MSDLLDVAVGLSREEVAALDDRTLVALADAIETLAGGDPIVRESDRERALERGLSRDLDAEYVESFDDALAEELPLQPEEMLLDDVGVLVSAVGRRIEDDVDGDRGVRIREIVAVAVAAMAVLGRRAGIASIGASGRSTAGISGSLSLVDRAAVDAISGQQLFWIGRLWSDHLSRTITATVRDEALLRGLGRVEVGRTMRGIVTGRIPGVAVPGAWRGGSESYFTMLAGTVRNQSSNFGTLSTFVEAGVTRYRIEAVLDRRTSRICNFMHGRTFSVSSGVANRTARLEATTPEEARAAALWRTPEDVELLPGFAEAPEDALARAGMALPPYHGNCRTVVVAD